MVDVPSNYPVNGPQGSNPTGNSVGSSNPQLTQYVDAAWQAIQAYQDSTSSNKDFITQTVMQTVNQLYTFLNANQSLDPQMYSDLTAGGNLNCSLADLCADYGTSNNQNAVTYLEGNMGGSLLSTLYKDFSSYGSVTGDSANTQIHEDFDALRIALDAYNQSPDSSNLTQVAAAISEFNFDAAHASPALSDGYLTSLMTCLNTPMTVGGTSQDTLGALSASGNYTELAQALQGIGEQNSNGGDLSALIQVTYKEEYDSSSF